MNLKPLSAAFSTEPAVAATPAAHAQFSGFVPTNKGGHAKGCAHRVPPQWLRAAVCAWTILSCAAGAAARTPHPLRYAVTDLGPRLSIDLCDGSTKPLAINDGGQIVGSESIAGEGMNQVWRAVLRDTHGRRVLEMPARYTSGYASGVNNAGQVAGYVESLINAEPVRVDNAAFLWSNAGPRLLKGFGNDSVVLATGINGHGDVTGYSQASSLWIDPMPTRAVLWRSGRCTPLGTLGGVESYAYAINDHDQIVGRSQIGPEDERADGVVTPATSHAFLWQDGRMHDLGTLPGDNEATATAINNQGLVVGSAEYDGPLRNPIPHAFLFSGGRMRDLGAGQAEAVSDTGVIAGTARGRAVIWRRGKRLLLDSLLSHRLGWRLREAFATNRQGQIVGYGTLAGKPHAFLLTPR